MNLSLADIGAVVWGVSYVACFLFALEVLRSPRPEQSISAWLLLFLFLPPAGAGLYLLLGRRKIRIRSEQKPPPHIASLNCPDSRPISIFDALVRSYGFAPAAQEERVTFYGTGEAAYAAVKQIIEQAKTSLWVSTYILSNDSVGKDIIRRLAERAATGCRSACLLMMSARRMRAMAGWWPP